MSHVRFVILYRRHDQDHPQEKNAKRQNGLFEEALQIAEKRS